MVDVSSQNNSVSINVSSSGNSASIKATPDTALFYSEKSREWAISNRIVNNEDYSSKYYANKSAISESNAKNYAQSSQDTYNQFQQSVDGALSNVDIAIQGAVNIIDTKSVEAIDNINSTKTTILNDIEFVADGEKKEIEDLIDNGKEELKESIGDVKVLTTLEIGDIGFTQMAIDETKGKRRVLNGQLIIQEQYVQFTNIIKASVALNPNLACTESEWQTAVTMSANGVCDKFVIDDEAGTIRLPKYPEYFDVSINGAKVDVYGTGMTLGLTNGSENAGLGQSYYGSYRYAMIYPGGYGKPVGSDGGDVTQVLDQTYGITKDSTKSGITGKVTNPSEQIRGTYFIQVATGAETEDNIINEIELNNPFSLLDYKYSEYELNNLSWLRSEGQYNSKAIYPAVYELLLKIYNGTETKAGVSVKLTTETFTDYDFVLNTAEETFRLPIKVKLASGKAVVGNGKTLGLTNGTTEYGLSNYTGTNIGSGINITYTGFSGKELPYNNTSWGSPATASDGLGVSQDPTNSGIETSDSGLYLYFYVGETVQNANLINAGRIEEVVSQVKADKLDRSAVKAYITQTYVNGTSWYRIYSDGWCEQGGLISNQSANATITTTFLKSFANTNYTLVGGELSSAGANTYHNHASVGYDLTTTGFKSDLTKTDSKRWYACGYIA